VSAVGGAFVAVKCSFKGEFSGYQGLLFLLGDFSERNFDRSYLLIASDPGIMGTRTDMGWQVFESAMLDAKLQGKVAPNLTSDFERKLREKLSSETGQELLRILERGDDAGFQETFLYEIGRMIGDSEVALQAHIERLSREDVHPPTEQREEASPASSRGEESVGGENYAPAAPQVSTAAMVVKIDPILSPVTGVAVADLKPGDRILTKIVESTDAARILGQIILQGGGAADIPGAVVAEVIAVEESDTERMRLRVHLMPGVEGIVPVAKEIKIRRTQDAAVGAPMAAPAPLDSFHEPLVGPNPAILFAGFAGSLFLLILAVWWILF